MRTFKSDEVTKVKISTVNAPLVSVEAQFNPKELQIDQNVPWKKPEGANQGQAQQQGANSTAGQSGGAAKPSGSDSDKNEDGMALEFTGAEGRSMTLELLFDDESGGGGKVTSSIAGLQQLAMVVNPKDPDETKRTPPLCVVTWGSTVGKFTCVVESLSIKYTMFSKAGAPLRATATVKLKEAERIKKPKAG